MGFNRKAGTKYKNKKTEIDGILFDSKREANRFLVLKEEERQGEIHSLKLQTVFILCPSVVINGRKRPPIRFICDFSYYRKDHYVVEDSKGVKTAIYKLKRHLLKSIYGIDILET